MIYLISVGILITYLLFIISKFQAYNRHNKILLELCYFRSEIFDLMKTEGFNKSNISTSDYKKLKEVLSITNTAINKYSTYKTGFFHIKSFIKFYRGFIKFVYSYDNNKKSNVELACNENIKSLQLGLSEILFSSVKNSTPPLFRKSITLALVSLLIALVAIIFSFQILNEIKSFIKWYGNYQNNYQSLATLRVNTQGQTYSNQG